jgi:hypothetical protein
MSFSFMGCVVGYKTFSVDEKHPAQPAPSLENIKIACTSDGGSWNCDSIQYILRTKYRILDVQAIGTDEADRFRIHVSYRDGKSKKGETWAVISALSFAILPAVLSEDHIYQFTITSPTGESATYDYQFTEKTYSWLPLFVFAPGYYEDVSGLSLDRYLKNRTSMFEDVIIPHLMVDAGPFLLSETSHTIK